MEKIPLQKVYVQDDKFLNALAEAYRLQEAIIGTTELAIISTNTEGIITSFNKAAETLYGYSAEEVIGKVTPYILHDPVEVEERSKLLSKELNRKVVPGFETMVIKARLKKVADRNEWTYIRKDKARLSILLSVTALWEDNKLIGYAGIGTDITEAKRKEKLLEKSEAHLQALLTSIDDIAFEVSHEKIYTNIWTKNDHLLIVSPRTEYLGKKISEVLSGELLKQFDVAIDSVFSTHQPQYLEYAIPNSDRWSAAKISYINDEKILMLVRNITERKKSQIELANSEQKFRAMAENIPGAIYLCKNDENYSMIYLNENIRKITGYTSDEFISNTVNFVQLYHPEDKEYIFNLVEKALNDRVSFQLEYRIKHKSGEWHWLEEIGTGVYTSNGLMMIEGFLSDITPRKLAEEELRRMADENSRVFNNSLHLNCIASFDGYFIKLNPVWEKTLGWTLEELKSRKYEEFIHPDDVSKTHNVQNHIFSGNALPDFENRYRCKDGSFRWLLWSSSPDVNRKLIYASAIDITERKKSEEELQRSKTSLEVAALELQEQNRQLDDFAHIISHNMRSPIGNISALISLLNQNSSNEDYQLIYRKLTDVSKNLKETMNELMETLKVKKNTDVVKTRLHFQEVLDKVIQSLQGEIIQTGTVIQSNFKSSSIYYSKTYLESIFQNLISNAIKYKARNRTPEIVIRAVQLENAIEMRVSDNGLGIDMKQYGDKLFGLHKTFHEHKEARGVGLFLVKTQIEALGGYIHVESEVGKGSTFIIHFAQ
ncbi:MAG: PAS domain S-box protein [Chryseolinea sp.]